MLLKAADGNHAVLTTRLRNLHTTATMVGGTLLFEGAHLIDAIHAFVAKQANVVITPLFLANPNTQLLVGRVEVHRLQCKNCQYRFLGQYPSKMYDFFS